MIGFAKKSLDAIEKQVLGSKDDDLVAWLAEYVDNPVGYCQTVLKIELTPQQQSIANALLHKPRKVLVPSGNSVGKSFLSAALINWWFDCRGPSVVISTAPTAEHVQKVLWSEVRMQRARRPALGDYFIGPTAPEMRRGPDWYAVGYTTRSPEAFQGRHRYRMLFVLDEATGIESAVWDRIRTMFDPDPQAGHGMLAIFNPLTSNCRAYIEDQLVDNDPSNPPWTRIRLNCLDHPNIRYDLTGEGKRIPGAIGLRMVEEWLRDWCTELTPTDVPLSTDVLFPPSWPCQCKSGVSFDTPSTSEDGKDRTLVSEHGTVLPFDASGVTPVTPESQKHGTIGMCLRCNGTKRLIGRYYRPGGMFQCSCLGLWPTEGDTIWSDALFEACCNDAQGPIIPIYPLDGRLPEVGCDTAMGKGEDFHAIHGRWGDVSIHHETANTMDPLRIAERLRAVCGLLAVFVNKRFPSTRIQVTPKQIHIKIDDDGTGGAITAILRSQGYWITPVGAGCQASDTTKYPRMRDQLWFAVADRAKKGHIVLSGLDVQAERRLKQQLMAPAWWNDVRGRRCVEPKEETKEKIARSPDDADAFNLAYHEAVGSIVPTAVTPEPQKEVVDDEDWVANRRPARRWA